MSNSDHFDFNPSATLEALRFQFPDIPLRILKTGVELEARWLPGTAQRYVAAFKKSDQAKRIRKAVPHEIKKRALSKPTRECLTALSERSHTFASLASATGRSTPSTRNLCGYLQDKGLVDWQVGERFAEVSITEYGRKILALGYFPNPKYCVYPI